MTGQTWGSNQRWRSGVSHTAGPGMRLLMAIDVMPIQCTAAAAAAAHKQLMGDILLDCACAC